jgi:hypothetical protein
MWTLEELDSIQVYIDDTIEDEDVDLYASFIRVKLPDGRVISLEEEEGLRACRSIFLLLDDDKSHSYLIKVEEGEKQTDKEIARWKRWKNTSMRKYLVTILAYGKYRNELLWSWVLVPYIENYAGDVAVSRHFEHKVGLLGDILGSWDLHGDNVFVDQLGQPVVVDYGY